MEFVLVLAVVLLALGLCAAVAALVAQGRHRADPAAEAATLAELQARLAATQAEQLQGSIDALLAVAGEKFADQSAAAVAQLDHREQAIAERFGEVTGELGRVRDLVHRLQVAQAEQQGQLAEGIANAVASTQALAGTTASLREALASTKARGQWGERMAEDVLRTAGFTEGVSYRKQSGLGDGGIPDFTFLLPQGRVLHMDVKFPLDNYLRCLEAEHDTERARCAGAFVKDVRNRIKEIGKRSYIDPDETVEAVLLFIPNEAVYAFVHEHDPDLIDVALGQKVVLCSPFTLFAVLAVVRQAVESFALARTTDEILVTLSAFTAEWGKFSEQIDTVSKRLETAQRGFDELAGTRRRQLQRRIDQVDELRQQRGLPAVDLEATPEVRPALDEAADDGGDPVEVGARPGVTPLRRVRLG